MRKALRDRTGSNGPPHRAGLASADRTRRVIPPPANDNRRAFGWPQLAATLALAAALPWLAWLVLR
jgi:hypothetical protein